jgi:hypothetical protein
MLLIFVKTPYLEAFLPSLLLRTFTSFDAAEFQFVTYTKLEFFKKELTAALS